MNAPQFIEFFISIFKSISTYFYGPRSHCELCPAARSHPVEPAHPQPCDLPLGHNPRWRQTPPGLETLLGFKSPKAAMNSSFCPPASPLLCRSVPTSCGAAGNSRNPGPRPLLTLLDPPSLPQRPSSPTLCRRVLPAPGTASSRTHPGLPHLAGGDLLPHLAPAPRWELGLGYPPPAPPTHRYPFPTPASLSYLGLAQCSQPSLTSLPEIPVSMWGQHLAKPPDGPTPTRGGFCLYNFLHLCQEDWVPCPSLASHISSWASCWLDASSENPPLLLSSPCCFHHYTAAAQEGGTTESSSRGSARSTCLHAHKGPAASRALRTGRLCRHWQG